MKTKNSLISFGLVISMLFCMAFACNESGGATDGERTQAGTGTTQNGAPAESENEQISTENQDAPGPRLGKYYVLSYGADPNNPMRLGHFDLLSGGKYKFYNDGGNFAGEGGYSFDAASNTVEWSGIFKNNGWGGTFEITREGKTHLIRLTRNTIGTNSTDSK